MKHVIGGIAGAWAFIGVMYGVYRLFVFSPELAGNLLFVLFVTVSGTWMGWISSR